jgi:hypothetical protein
MMEKADKEYYGEFLKIRAAMMSDGWKEVKLTREHDMIEATFSKNGYSTHLLFGCEEKIKEEIL